MVYTFDKDNTEALLSRLQNDDIVEIRGEDLINLLNGKNDTGSRGRKPIQVDLSLFDKTVERWQNGEITAREAMKTLDLKPNTFYRRIKERSVNDMIDVKAEIKEVKKQIHEDAADVKQAVENKKEAIGMEREILHDKVGARIEHVEDVISMKRAVSKEAEAYKSSKD